MSVAYLSVLVCILGWVSWCSGVVRTGSIDFDMAHASF